MEASQSAGTKSLLRRVPLGLWVLVALLAVGGIATAIEGPSGTSGELAVGSCLTGDAGPTDVACDDPQAAMRITEVFDSEYTAGTLADLTCPEGSSIIEQRSVLDDDEDLPQMAACAEPVR